ncbi:MAG: NAD-dependent epimerase/dehydratase family protein [Crocinitomicaceae bacterium]|nr:NAD-dependent epimerase/dehydratase family protein [Crocinitomicaceae bacterium]
MNILLTGSTGFLGFRTLERLVQLPTVKKVVATGRCLRKSREILHPKVKYILGDLTDELFVKTLMKDIDVIINTASLSSPWGSEESFYLANVLSQKNIIYSAETEGVKRFIYISSPSIYYNGEDRLLVKESDPLPTKFVNNYSKTKRSAEVLLENSKQDYIIIRPRAIIGRGDTIIMPRLIKAHSEGRLKIIGDGENEVDLTSVDNVVESIVLSINAPNNAWNHAYNITDGNPVSLWRSINTVLQGIGKRKIEKNIKFSIAYSVASILEWASIWVTKKEPSLTKYSVGVLSKTFTLDISKAKKILGYNPVVTTEESIEEFIKWYKKNERD